MGGVGEAWMNGVGDDENPRHDEMFNQRTAIMNASVAAWNSHLKYVVYII